MEIAVTGIDGSGKTTLVRGAVKYLRRHGIDAGHIDCPYFRAVPGLERLSRLLGYGWHWVDSRQSKFFFSLMSFFAALVYFAARWKLRGKDILFVEHHPKVDMAPYARLYGGKLGFWAARLIVWLWPKPATVVRISLTPEIAYKRLLKRGKRLQPHETLRSLRRLNKLIKESVQQSAIDLIVFREPGPEELIDWFYQFGRTRQPN
jgi:thymidylate kinase